MSALLIQGAQVVNPLSPGDVRVEIRDVAVEGNYIAQVGDEGVLPPGFKPDHIIDGQGCALIPGMINCHTHAAMTLLRGFADDVPLDVWLKEHIWPVEEGLKARDVYLGTQLACLEMMRAGITTFSDMYFFMDEVARATREAGLRARLSRGLIGIADGSMQTLDEAVEWAHRWAGEGDGRISTELGPHAIYTCPPEFMKQVIDRAHRENLGLHTHISETRGEVERCLSEHGRSPVRVFKDLGAFELPLLAAHLTHLVEGDVEILAQAGVGVALNPVSNQKLGGGLPPAVELIEAGARVGLGTDGAASAGHVNLFSEMRALSLPQKALRERPESLNAGQCFYSATRGGALALGMERLGLIQPGYLADLVLVDLQVPHLVPVHNVLSALVYGALGSEVRTVICNGEIILRDGHPTGLDQAQVMREATRAAVELVRRVRTQ